MTDTSTNDNAPDTASAAPRKSRRKTALAKGTASLKSGSDALRQRAATLVQDGDDAIEAHPIAAVAGAVALGAVIGALIPTTDEEVRLAGPVGDRLRLAADSAVKAARSAGIEHLTSTGLTSAALSSGVGGILGAVIKGALAARQQEQATHPQPTAPTPATQSADAPVVAT
jgi:ElaB/YqjD/DUF883 family membrane-anchored ribosome-binding protein